MRRISLGRKDSRVMFHGQCLELDDAQLHVQAYFPQSSRVHAATAAYNIRGRLL